MPPHLFVIVSGEFFTFFHHGFVVSPKQLRVIPWFPHSQTAVVANCSAHLSVLELLVAWWLPWREVWPVEVGDNGDKLMKSSLDL